MAIYLKKRNTVKKQSEEELDEPMHQTLARIGAARPLGKFPREDESQQDALDKIQEFVSASNAIAVANPKQMQELNEAQLSVQWRKCVAVLDAEASLIDSLPKVARNLIKLATGDIHMYDAKKGVIYRKAPDLKAIAYLMNRVMGLSTQQGRTIATTQTRVGADGNMYSVRQEEVITSPGGGLGNNAMDLSKLNADELISLRSLMEKASSLPPETELQEAIQGELVL